MKNPTPKHPELLTVDEVAAELGVGKRQVYELVHAGALARLPYMHRWRITRASLDAFVAGGGA